MSHGVSLRLAGPADAPACFALDQRCFNAEIAYSIEMFDHLCSHAAAFWVAELDGQIVGFVAADTGDEPDVGVVVTLDIAPEQRRRGIGRRLLAAAEASLVDLGVGTIFLQVFVENEGALKLYQSSDYATICRFNDYYGPHKDALLLMRETGNKDG
jgi:[ribosomal protein S18]-alanine N-acetyltransferase